VGPRAFCTIGMGVEKEHYICFQSCVKTKEKAFKQGPTLHLKADDVADAEGVCVCVCGWVGGWVSRYECFYSRPFKPHYTATQVLLTHMQHHSANICTDNLPCLSLSSCTDV
jgi:hypothetical protein